MKKIAICILVIILIIICIFGYKNISKTSNNQTETNKSSQNMEEPQLSYEYQNFEDWYYHFKLKTPKLNCEEYIATSYYVERLGDKEDDMAIFMIAHFNERQESYMYDASKMGTAATSLDELLEGKIDELMRSKFGLKLKDCQYETETTTIAGLDAVRFTGSFLFDYYGSDRESRRGWVLYSWKIYTSNYCCT